MNTKSKELIINYFGILLTGNNIKIKASYLYELIKEAKDSAHSTYRKIFYNKLSDNDQLELIKNNLLNEKYTGENLIYSGLYDQIKKNQMLNAIKSITFKTLEPTNLSNAISHFKALDLTIQKSLLIEQDNILENIIEKNAIKELMEVIDPKLAPRLLKYVANKIGTDAKYSKALSEIINKIRSNESIYNKHLELLNNILLTNAEDIADLTKQYIKDKVNITILVTKHNKKSFDENILPDNKMEILLNTWLDNIVGKEEEEEAVKAVAVQKELTNLNEHLKNYYPNLVDLAKRIDQYTNNNTTSIKDTELKHTSESVFNEVKKYIDNNRIPANNIIKHLLIDDSVNAKQLSTILTYTSPEGGILGYIMKALRSVGIVKRLDTSLDGIVRKVKNSPKVEEQYKTLLKDTLALYEKAINDFPYTNLTKDQHTKLLKMGENLADNIIEIAGIDKETAKQALECISEIQKHLPATKQEFSIKVNNKMAKQLIYNPNRTGETPTALDYVNSIENKLKSFMEYDSLTYIAPDELSERLKKNLEKPQAKLSEFKEVFSFYKDIKPFAHNILPESVYTLLKDNENTINNKIETMGTTHNNHR